jgi:hypothetical protein
VLTRIWQPGAVVGLQGVGFAARGAFISLNFSSHGWPYAGIGLTCFGLGFVAVRFTWVTCPTRSAVRRSRADRYARPAHLNKEKHGQVA